MHWLYPYNRDHVLDDRSRKDNDVPRVGCYSPLLPKPFKFQPAYRTVGGDTTLGGG